MNKIISILVAFLFSQMNYAEIVMGVEAPACVGKPVKTEAQAKCIALFYSEFKSFDDVVGGTWDVVAVKREDIWFIYPKVPTEFNPADKILYKINAKTGIPLGYE